MSSKFFLDWAASFAWSHHSLITRMRAQLSSVGRLISGFLGLLLSIRVLSLSLWFLLLSILFIVHGIGYPYFCASVDGLLESSLGLQCFFAVFMFQPLLLVSVPCFPFMVPPFLCVWVCLLCTSSSNPFMSPRPNNYFFLVVHGPVDSGTFGRKSMLGWDGLIWGLFFLKLKSKFLELIQSVYCCFLDEPSNDKQSGLLIIYYILANKTHLSFTA